MPMQKSSDKRIIAAVDIGSSEVSVIACEIDDNGHIDVIGVGVRPSEGIQKGMISDIDATVRSIGQAVDEAAVLSRKNIDTVYVGIAGSHIRSQNSQGAATIRGHEVTQDDINRFIESASAVNVASHEEVLHVLPQSFSLDGQSGIKNPIGLSGSRLEVGVHVVTANSSAVQNIFKCIGMCNLEVGALILTNVASSQAVLTEDERELGIAVLDIGDGTTDFAVYDQGSIRHSASFPIGGSQITGDIAIVLRTSTELAKKIKHRYGTALHDELGKDRMVEVPTIGEHQIHGIYQFDLVEVIVSRLDQIFSQISDHISSHELLDFMRSGIVLTGGTARLDGIQKVMEKYFDIPVRLGHARYSGSMAEIIRHPKLATAMGICEYAATNERYYYSMKNQHRDEHGANRLSRFLDHLLRNYRNLQTHSTPSATPDAARNWLNSNSQ